MGTALHGKATHKSFDRPDETREFPNGQVAVVQIDGATIGHFTCRSGWRWSQHVKPIAGTDSCEAPHLGYVLTGRMKIVMNDGSEDEIGPGDVYSIDPGHDAWVVGPETFTAVDFAGSAAKYAK